MRPFDKCRTMTRPVARRSLYPRLSAAEKRQRAREAIREPAVACQLCGAQVGVADLLPHLALRCPEHRDPHPRSRWINWREAIDLGVFPGTMSRWVKRGIVRIRDGEERRYLMRDVVLRIAERRVQQRQFPIGNRRK